MENELQSQSVLSANIKKSGSERISWNEEKELALLNQVFAQKIHKKTPKHSQASKWLRASVELARMPQFKGYRADVISEEALKQKLKILKKNALKEWALLKAGSNSVGFTEPTPKQQLLYNLLDHEQNSKNVNGKFKAINDKNDDEMNDVEDFVKNNGHKRLKKEHLKEISSLSDISCASSSSNFDEMMLQEFMNLQAKRLKLKEEELMIRKLEAENAQKRIEFDREARLMLYKILNNFVLKEATNPDL